MKDRLLSIANSVRLAFLLHLLAKVATLGLSLFWTRLLLQHMGVALNGTFLTFQAIASLGGLGDLGLGGAISLRLAGLLPPGREAELQDFLSQARTVFALLAAVISITLITLAPVLPIMLGFQSGPHTGSLHLLFLLGGIAAGGMVLQSYFTNLNYASSNIVLPIVPSVVLAQAAVVAHCIFASRSAPLWLQYLPYVVTLFAGIWVNWRILHFAKPELSALWPLRWSSNNVVTLFRQSGWLYLVALGSSIFTSTDRILINALIGPDWVPRYQLNYKACEIATFGIMTAAFVAMPGIAQSLASIEENVRQAGGKSALDVNRFHMLLAGVFSLVYLAVNDRFVEWWVGKDLIVPIMLQASFVLVMISILGASVALAVAARLDDASLRYAAKSVVWSAGVNLLLSLVSALILRSVLGVALATVVSQIGLGIALGKYVADRINVPARLWLRYSVFRPLLFAIAAILLRQLVSPINIRGCTLLVGGDAILLALLFHSLHFTKQEMGAEWERLRRAFVRKRACR